MVNPANAKVVRDLVDFVADDKAALELFANAGTDHGHRAFEVCKFCESVMKYQEMVSSIIKDLGDEEESEDGEESEDEAL